MTSPEEFSMIVLTQAVAFLFDEARKILAERRERRQKMGEPDDAVVLPAGVEESTKEGVLKLKPAKLDEEMQKEIEHLLRLIEIQNAHRRKAEVKINKLGGIDWVPPNVRFELENAEDEIFEHTQRLKKLLERVYNRPIYIDGLGAVYPASESQHTRPLPVELHTIRTARKKEVPQGTQIKLALGSIPGAVRVWLQLPGQAYFSDLGDRKIVDGVLELPAKLLFLSYAHEDQSVVEGIADKLSQDGFLTWLDKKDLLPGDDWKARIEDGIERADYVLVFLSKISCAKVGYVQRELKYALEQRDLRPRGHRYIIPILLEPCDPPRELRDIHWLENWEEGAYDKLRKALER